MNISALQVKELREKTGVGMMECKKALEENAGDLQKSILWLRERGMSRAAKKADRIAAEGLVEVLINDDANAGVVLEVNCETDFVSKNDDFKKLVKDIAAIALKKQIHDVEVLAQEKLASGKTITETIGQLIQTIGENMKLRRVQYFSTNNGCIAGYIHMGGKIGTLIVLEGQKSSEVINLGKDIAMHIAAANPRFLNSDMVKKDELLQERELERKKLVEEKKPEAMIEKILEGKMRKFYQEVCLLDQAFVKDTDTTVGNLIKKSGDNLKAVSFARFQLGEGIEKKSEDFAAEVAAQLKN